MLYYPGERRTTRVLTCRDPQAAFQGKDTSPDVFWSAEFFSALDFFIFGFTEVLNIATKEQAINERIRAQEVRVIDSDGSQLGIMKTRDALQLAYDKGLDLVEMSAQGPQSVCKIMDYGKYRFDRSKKEKESRKKQVTVELKEIKFSCRIGQHDFDTKIGHVKRFLSAGNKVKVTIMFSGREMSNKERGFVMMDKIGEILDEIATVEKKPKLEGRFLTMFVAPKKNTTTSKGREENGKDQNA
ncbi:MAG: translation initiation factor IF-3 [Clostridia bacterium]|nr:translation initiation factor IF-3 [Clostridia bacterium]